AAVADTGAPAIAGDVGRIAIPRGTWSSRAPGHSIAGRIGATKSRTVLADLGVPQQSLINDALAAIARGDIDVAIVVGGEARRREITARRTETALPIAGSIDEGVEDERWPLAGELAAPAEREVGAVAPVQQYAMIENALGHAEGRSLDAHQDEIATLYEAFDAVAGTNPHAVFAGGRTAAFLRTPGPGN